MINALKKLIAYEILVLIENMWYGWITLFFRWKWTNFASFKANQVVLQKQ